MKLFQLTANRIMVNSYLLVSDNGEAVLIDPGCDSPREESELLRLLQTETSLLKYILLTHAHIDHIAGCAFVKGHYPESPHCAHQDALHDYSRANSYSAIFGFNEREYPPIDRFLQEGETLCFGTDRLKVIHTPGHAQGSVCYYHLPENWNCPETQSNSENSNNSAPSLFSGDTLFCQSVGRCDLPGGDAAKLGQSLQKIAGLPAETRIYPGHGETTDLYFEINNNPYLYQIRHN